jgi:hypothetical protein
MAANNEALNSKPERTEKIDILSAPLQRPLALSLFLHLCRLTTWMASLVIPKGWQLNPVGHAQGQSVRSEIGQTGGA